MQLMKYNVEFYSFLSKKWGKIVFNINTKGNLTMHMTPTFTPGKEDEELKGKRFIPKNYKLFDYSQTVIVNLTYSDIFEIIKWHKGIKNPINTVEIYRVGKGTNKKITINWYEVNGKIQTATFFVNLKDSSKNMEINFKIPIGLDTLDEIVFALNSYLQNYAVIQLLANTKFRYDEDDIDIMGSIVHNSMVNIFKKTKLPGSEKLKNLEIKVTSDNNIYKEYIDEEVTRNG